MYPGQTHSFIQRYEEAVQSPFGYLLVDLKTTTQDNCRLRTKVLPGEERFDQCGTQQNISQELLQYLKQQNLATPPVLPAVQQLRDNMDGLLARSDLGGYEKARQYVQLQNKYLTFQRKLNFQKSRTKSRQRNFNQFSYKQFTKVHSRTRDITTNLSSSASGSASEPSPCASGDTRDSNFSAIGCASGDSTQSLTSITPTRHLNTPPSKQKRKLPPIQFRNYLNIFRIHSFYSRK